MTCTLILHNVCANISGCLTNDTDICVITVRDFSEVCERENIQNLRSACAVVEFCMLSVIFWKIPSAVFTASHMLHHFSMMNQQVYEYGDPYRLSGKLKIIKARESALKIFSKVEKIVFWKV